MFYNINLLIDLILCKEEGRNGVYCLILCIPLVYKGAHMTHFAFILQIM